MFLTASSSVAYFSSIYLQPFSIETSNLYALRPAALTSSLLLTSFNPYISAHLFTLSL